MVSARVCERALVFSSCRYMCTTSVSTSETLHWLQVTHRIQYKISAICFNSISGTAPQYLSDLLQLYTPARQVRSTSNTSIFVIPHVNTKTLVKDHFLLLAHLFRTIFLKHSAILILPLLLNLPSKCTCSITISELFFTAYPIPPCGRRVCVCVSECVCA